MQKRAGILQAEKDELANQAEMVSRFIGELRITGFKKVEDMTS